MSSDGTAAAILNLPLRLRSDLRMSVRGEGERAWHLLEDPIQLRFYRVGPTEWAILEQLDGRRQLGGLEAGSLSPSELVQLGQWLLGAQLVEAPDGGRLLHAAQRRGHRLRWLQRLNLLSWRLPLFNPDAGLDRLLPYCRWLLGWPFFLLWLAVCLHGLYRVLADGDRFRSFAAIVFSPGDLPWLIAAWVLLKIVHESFHGLVCKHYGGRVHEAGLLFILFVPLGYVDASAAWRFASRWQRIHVAIAGIYSELFIAALAAWVWSMTSGGPLAYFCYNLVLIGSIGTVLTNANPLMRFDGYYVLADWLDIPNLYTRGQQYVGALLRRHLLALPINSPEWPGMPNRLIRIYGLASYVWRLLVLSGLLVVAGVSFAGGGLVLALTGAVLWFALPIRQFWMSSSAQIAALPGQRARSLVRFGMVSALLGLALAMPWSVPVSAPAVVDYADLAIVRAPSAGFVRALRVHAGEHVKAGQVLVEMENPKLLVELADTRLRLREHQLRGDVYRQRGSMAAAQAEATQLQALDAQAQELQARVDKLSVRAPQNGSVVARGLEAMAGQYFQEGAVLLVVGDETRKEVHFSVGQSDAEHFRHAPPDSIAVELIDRPGVRLQVDGITLEPKATRRLPHPALSAQNGGELSVRADVAAGSELLGPAESVLAETRFNGRVALQADSASAVFAGERVAVRAAGPALNLFSRARRGFSAWVRHLSGDTVG